MDKLIKQVTKILKKFRKEGFTLISEDMCPTHLFYETIEGYEIVLGDDDEREEYQVNFEDIKDRDGVKVTDEKIMEILKGLFGDPKVMKDMKGEVCNNIWEPTKKTRVHFHGGYLEVYRDYVKN